MARIGSWRSACGICVVMALLAGDAEADDLLAGAAGEDGASAFDPSDLRFSLGELAIGPAPRAAADEFDFDDEEVDLGEQERPTQVRKKKTGMGRYTFSGSVIFTGYPWTDFEFGDVDDGWDDAWKFEGNITGYYGLSDRVNPFAGLFFSYDIREWEGGSSSSIDYQTYSIGAELGALLHAFKAADKRALNLPIVPFIRFGLGFNDGDFDRVPVGNDLFISGDIDGIRFEIGGGLDVRLIIAQTVMVGIGGGVTYWNALQMDGVVRNGVGIVVINDDEADFHGLEAFARLMVGIMF